MKIARYALFIAAASVAGVAFAQTAPQNAASTQASQQTAQKDGDFAVSASVNDGVITLSISGKAGALDSASDSLKKAVAAALRQAGVRSNIAKALEATMANIKAYISDPNAPAKGDVTINVVLEPKLDTNEIVTKAEVSVAGEKFTANTNSKFADDGSVSTTGSVSKVAENGTSQDFSVNTEISANGDITVKDAAGNTVAISRTEAAQGASNLVSSSLVPNEVGGGASNNEVIPDNTVVTSANN